MAYPLQRNQQPYIVIGGITYTWDVTTGQYRDPYGRVLGAAPAPPQPATIDIPGASQPNTGPTAPSNIIDIPGASGPNTGPTLPPNTIDIPSASRPNTGSVPAPDPYQGWLSSAAGSRSWRYFTPELQAYYEQNPDEVFRQYTTSEFGDRQTPMLDYARNNYQDYWARYIKASEGHEDMHFTDTLSDDLAGQIRQSFTMQSPTQKGYNLMWQPAGRVP